MLRSFILTASLTALTTLGAVGCQSSNTPTAANDAVPSQAVTCDKCKTTWVKIPETAKGRVVGYTSRKEMSCPDCKSAVENFFTTGQLKHSCATCGGNMAICDSH